MCLLIRRVHRQPLLIQPLSLLILLTVKRQLRLRWGFMVHDALLPNRRRLGAVGLRLSYPLGETQRHKANNNQSNSLAVKHQDFFSPL